MFKHILLMVLMMIAIEANARLPKEDIRVIVTGNPGSSLGIVAQLFEAYSISKGVKVKLDWRPGADSIIGANHFSRQVPNGTTLLLSSVYEVTRDASYQTFDTNSIAPVGMVPMAPMWIVAHPDVPYNNLTELVTALKKDPQAVSWAITNKMFESVVSESANKIGIDYNDLLATKFNAKGSLAVAALLGRHLDVGLLVTPIIKPLVDSKKLKLLGVVNKDDYTPGPEVENLETVVGYRPTKHGHVLFLSAKTSLQIQMDWAKFFQQFIEDPEVKKKLAKNYLPAPVGNNQDLARKIFNEHTHIRHKTAELSNLTNRQEQVLALIRRRGYSNKSIAQALNISESGVKAHVKEILKKYNVKTRGQLIAFG